MSSSIRRERPRRVCHGAEPALAGVGTARVGGVEDTDRTILTLLAADGRMSFTDLGKATGLSTSAVHQRVKRLEKRGLITGYGASVDHDAARPAAHRVRLDHARSTPPSPTTSPSGSRGIREIESLLVGGRRRVLHPQGPRADPAALEDLLARIRSAANVVDPDHDRAVHAVREPPAAQLRDEPQSRRPTSRRRRRGAVRPTVSRAVSRRRAVPGGVGHLAGEVEQLLHPAHEVTGREVGLAEHLVEVVALGPPVGRPGEPEVGLAEEVQLVLALERVEVAPTATTISASTSLDPARRAAAGRRRRRPGGTRRPARTARPPARRATARPTGPCRSDSAATRSMSV